MKVIHVTDTHFMPHGETYCGVDPRANLDRCIEVINRNHADADLCVITGDLVHAGDVAAYTNLKEALSYLTLPIRFTLGNEDDRANFRQVFPEVPVDDNGFVQSVQDIADARLIFLDTNEPGAKPVASGHLCARRIDWLNAQLNTADDRRCYVFMHHPPFAVGLDVIDGMRLRDTEALRSAVLATGRLRHMFFGHVHRPLSGSWLGIPFSLQPSLIVQTSLEEPAARGDRGSYEQPAFGIILINDECVISHTHFYQLSRGTFDWTTHTRVPWTMAQILQRPDGFHTSPEHML